MSDYTHTGLEVVGRHRPDPGSGPFESMADAQKAGHDTLNPTTGTYELGVLIDGAFIPFFVEKASLVTDAVDLAKQQQAKQQSSQPQPTQGDTSQQPQGDTSQQ